MENFALWALLISITLISMCSLILQANMDPELRRVSKAAAARRGAPVRRAAIATATLTVINGVFWTLMAFGDKDWRWAAIFWIPFLAGFLSKFMNSGEKAQT